MFFAKTKNQSLSQASEPQSMPPHALAPKSSLFIVDVEPRSERKIAIIEPSFDLLPWRHSRVHGARWQPFSIGWCTSSVVRAELRVLSLSRWRKVFVYLWQYGRNLGQILRDYQR